MGQTVKINSVSQVHQFLGIEGPRHPLITILPVDERIVTANYGDTLFVMDLFQVSLKNGINGNISYGRNSYDFQEGTMVFTRPGQSMKFSRQEDFSNVSGWTLIFHADLIRKSELGRVIQNYAFFSYEMYEALHVSEEEQKELNELIQKIKKEYSQNIDRHSQQLMVATIKLGLDYCTRYYDRQFLTRTNLNQNYVSRVESLLVSYFQSTRPVEDGIPSVKFLGEALNMSPHYLSDMLKKETGKSAQEHIHFFLLDEAKTRLLNSEDSISEIAYSLGFDYPNHFSKLFKAKTGESPVAYRSYK